MKDSSIVRYGDGRQVISVHGPHAEADAFPGDGKRTSRVDPRLQEVKARQAPRFLRSRGRSIAPYGSAVNTALGTFIHLKCNRANVSVPSRVS